MSELEPTTGSVETQGGATATITMTLAAPGIYDPEKQLSPHEVIVLKGRFKAEDSAPDSLAGKVCAHIATLLMTSGFSEHATREDAQIALEDEDLQPLIGEGGMFADEREFGKTVVGVAVGWYACLKMALELPEAEWPAGMSPPATFAEALKEIDAEEAARKA